MKRTPLFDPRTVAREIPGLFDSILPQLTPGVVAAFNRDATTSAVVPIDPDEVSSCTLQHAMLFELGFAVAEMLIESKSLDWEACIDKAVERQRRHFDARIPESIPDHDKNIAVRVGENILSMAQDLGRERGSDPVLAPKIPGFEWIASGNGDIALGTTLVEVKCSARNFSAADYRQLTMYWLLSYARAVEGDSVEWSEGILMNPRSGQVVSFSFSEFLRTVSAGRSKAEILGHFSAMVGTRSRL